MYVLLCHYNTVDSAVSVNYLNFYNALCCMYLVYRASIEPNFHDLYLKFLDKVNSKALNKEVVQATYENCKVCYNSVLFSISHVFICE